MNGNLLLAFKDVSDDVSSVAILLAEVASVISAADDGLLVSTLYHSNFRTVLVTRWDRSIR